MPSPPDLDASRVVVAEFENQTGDESLDVLGRMAADWITQGLSHAGVVETVPSMTILGFFPQDEEDHEAKGSARLRTVAEETGAGTVVSGTYYLEGDELHVQSTITDLVEDKVLYALEPVRGPRDEAVEIINQLRGRIMGALAAHFGNESELHLQGDLYQSPVSEAYQEFILGVDHWGKDFAQARNHFEQAVALDPSFFIARFYLWGTYRDLGKYAEAEELALVINRDRQKLTPFERHYFDWGLASYKRDYEEALRCLHQAQNLAPNSSVITYLFAGPLLELNRPRELIEIYSTLEFRSTRVGVAWWPYENLADAQHMLGNYHEELDDVRRGRKISPSVLALRSHEARALAALGRVQEIHDVIDESLSRPQILGSPGEIMLEAADELRAHGNRVESMRIVERSIEWHRSRPSKEAESEKHRYVLARTYYTGEMWNEARTLFDDLAEEYPDKLAYKGYLGVLALRRADQSEAVRISKELELIDRPRMFGENLYWLASMAAVGGDHPHAINLLREALAQGHGYFRIDTLEHDQLSLHCEMNFESIRDDPDFQELIRPKG